MPLTVPNTFAAHTLIESAKFNQNFNVFGQAVNVAGDTLTGLLQTQAIEPSADNTYDVGSVSLHYKDGYFSGNVHGNITGNITGNVTGNLTGNVTGGTVSGTLSGDGSAVTGITEAHITDGTILARVAANETITGAWTFNSVGGLGGSAFEVTSVAPGIYFNETDAGSNAKNWLQVVDGAIFQIQTRNDANVFVATPFQLDRAGNVAFTGGITEHSRAFKAGVTQQQAYSGGLYFATGGTWTVDLADQINYSWRILGDTMTVNVNLLNTTIVSTPSQLFITLPTAAGITASQETHQFYQYCKLNGGLVLCLVKIDLSSGTLSIVNPAGTFPAGTDNNDFSFTASFKVT